jgi:hypothetical protein
MKPIEMTSLMRMRTPDIVLSKEPQGTIISKLFDEKSVYSHKRNDRYMKSMILEEMISML